MDRFPYLRTAPDGVCELCHRTDDVLVEVTIRPPEQVVIATATKKGKRWTMRRTVRVCRRHPRANGRPVVTPRTTMLAGTTALRPQRERLFDRIPYRKAGEA